MKQIPRSRYAFVLALYKENLRIAKSDAESARRMNVRWTGTLPYAAAAVYSHLGADMRLMRRLQSEGHSVPGNELRLLRGLARPDLPRVAGERTAVHTGRSRILRTKPTHWITTKPDRRRLHNRLS